ncbi:MAG TPA: glycoside hydrolase family 140 protein [Niabella sp.]|nr:glycoside hydrolase family 140 protein [Niabella sp.]
MKKKLVLLVFSIVSIAVFAQSDQKTLKITADGHYLEYEDGTPFFWLGDTGWHLFRSLTREEIIKYLDNRQQKGFNVIQCVIEAGEKNKNGEVPFPNSEPSKLNDQFFAEVDWVIQEAAKRNIYIALLPTWGHSIFPFFAPDEPVIFNEKNAYTYGKAIGNRYKNYTNIVWVAGGDRPAFVDTADWRPIYRSMMRGIKDGGAKQLVTYHPVGESSSTDFWKDDDLLDFNMLQSGHRKPDLPTWAWIKRDREYKPYKPVIDSEPNYEEHPINWKPEMGYFKDYDVRKQLYRSVFSGAAGVTYGHHSIWQFHQKGKFAYAHPKKYWYESLDDPGAFQAGYLRKLMESRPAVNRIPDGEMVINPPTGEEKLITSFYHEDGSYAMVYIPCGQTVNINTRHISGNKIRAWWYDPGKNKALKIGKLKKSGEMSFTPPSSGVGNDWVLIIDNASKKYKEPGKVKKR